MLVKNAFATLLLLFTLCANAAPDDSVLPPNPWFGTWISGTSTLTMEPWEDGIKMLEVRPLESGETGRIVAFIRMDGRIYPESGVKLVDGITFNKIDARSYEYTGTKAGKVLMRSVISFPLDGLTRLSHMTLFNGEKVDRTTVWKRKQVRTAEPWFGIWKRDEYNVQIMEPWEDGFLLTFTTLPAKPEDKLEHGSIFARFDGREYHESGNDSADALVYKRIDDRTFTVTSILNGKPTTTATISFPMDGKTRLSKTTGVDKNGKPVNRSAVWTRAE